MSVTSPSSEYGPVVERLSAEPDGHRVLRRSAPLVVAHRWALLAAVITSAVATAATLVGPVLVGVAVDAVLDGRRGRLAAAAGAYAAVAVMVLLLERARRLLAARAGERLLADLRDAVAHRLVARPLAFFDRHATGELVARATTDVQALSGFVRSGLPKLVDALLLLVITSVVVVATSWPLALVTVVYFPGLVVAVRRYRAASGPAYAAWTDADAATTAAIGETVASRPFLQGVDATGAWSARVAAVDRALLSANDDALRAENRLSILGFWQQLVLALVVLAGGVLVSDGTTTVGALATVMLALRQLFGPLDELSWLYADAQQSRSNLARLLEVLAGPDLPVDDPARTAGPPDRSGLGIEVRDVTYRYASDVDHDALVGIDLAVGAGARVAVVGATGSGKSTLAKVTAGLLPATAGAVRIGDRTVADWDPVALRRAVVLLPQEGHIFAGTLADNLRLVPGDHRDADLFAAVERAGLSEWVARLPGGLDTVLADRGANLSAGERQLVSLARAALADPAVLLLDEATADIDPSTEALVTDALDRVTAGRTVIVVAHRPATASRCDRVVTLADGHLVAEHPNPHPPGRHPPGRTNS